MTLRGGRSTAAAGAAQSMPGRVVAASALAHAAVVAAIVWRAAPAPVPASDGAALQVEFINQTAATSGVANPDTTATRAEEPTPAGAPSVSPPPPAESYGDVPMPPGAAPSNATAIHAGRPADAPGGAAADRDSLTVTGQGMVSSGPDAAYRNMPPNFPREALRAHQQGSVQVAIHINPAGLADDVETLISSGSASLDNAVRNAVMKWHFKPAMKDGVAVASVYKLQMNFRSDMAP